MTKKFDHLRNLTANITPKDDVTQNSRPKTAPILTAEATKRLHDAEARAELLERQLKDVSTTGGPLEISLDQLHEIPGRKRTLDEENYSILKNNLANNSLITPIVVRKRVAGGYEIISGHNRTQAFRELGRTTIPAVIADINDEDANKDAFFANLIHSALPDYEKYLGFEKLLAEKPGITQEALAESIGVPRGTIAGLLSFRRLPMAAHKILQVSPNAVGYTSAKELAAIAENENADLVAKAIELIANKELDQTKAKDWIQKELAATKTAPAPKAENRTYVIKRGRTPFCNMRLAKKVLRIEFTSAEEAEELQSQIHEFLKGLAKG